MTDIQDHWYSPCVSMSMNHNIWYTLFLLFSKPQLCNCTRVEQHDQPRIFTKTERDHYLYASCCHAVLTLLCAASLYAIHRQPLSHRLIKKYILWSRSFCEFALASLWDCMLFCFQTSDPGSLVARPSRKPYTTKVTF